MKKIGMDISIPVCKAEGYMTVDLVKFTTDKLLHFTATMPDYCNKKVTDKLGRKTRHNSLRVDTFLSWEDLVEIYERHKAGIDSFCDYENCKSDFNNPTIYDALRLASDIDAYCGLN